MKANFKISRKATNYNLETKSNENKDDNDRKLTKEEFENYMIKNGAAGSFMIFRSNKKEDELGLEEL